MCLAGVIPGLAEDKILAGPHLVAGIHVPGQGVVDEDLAAAHGQTVPVK